MKYIVICPFGARTGGPEALFQLSDALIRNGFEAELWLVTGNEIQEFAIALEAGRKMFVESFRVSRRENTIGEYSHYKQKSFVEYSKGESVTIILPEVFTWITPTLLSQRVLVWWLSVDNAFGSLVKHNLNFLRLPNVSHAAQSKYAQNFLGSLGLECRMLSDYTVTMNVDKPSPRRPYKVAINAGSKCIFSPDVILSLISNTCPKLETLKVVGLDRQQVFNAFITSRLFIDLGNFPGKDRMIREALALGASVILARVGAGSLYDDFPIPDIYKVLPHDTNRIVNLAKHILDFPELHSPMFATARSEIANEQQTFNNEVLSIFADNF